MDIGDVIVVILVLILITCVALFAWAMVLKHDMKQTCIHGGYAGLQYMDGLEEYVCYVIQDGTFVIVPIETVRLELEKGR